MSVPHGWCPNPCQDVIGNIADVSAPAARSRPLAHLKPTPSIVSRQRSWKGNMKKATHSDTPRGVKNTPRGVTARRMWNALKELEPHNTEKRLADALSEQGGKDISHRTVGGWRYKLPSGKYLVLLFITFPDLIRHLKSSAEQRQANYDALARRHEKLQAQGLEEHGTRESRCDNDRESFGD